MYLFVLFVNLFYFDFAPSYTYIYIQITYYSFNCDSSNAVYLLECTVCGVQYVGSICTPFRLRFNNYKACSRKFNSGASVPQVEFFRHFTEESHHGFLKYISVKIIDRITGEIGCGKASGNIGWIALPLRV